jgi:hypothetical protein
LSVVALFVVGAAPAMSAMPDFRGPVRLKEPTASSSQNLDVRQMFDETTEVLAGGLSVSLRPAPLGRDGRI